MLYVDTYLGLNFLVDFVLLLATGKIIGQFAPFWRLSLGALLGAFYALCPFVGSLAILVHPLGKLGAAVLMVAISYGFSGIVPMTLVFLALGCSLAGLLYGVALLGISPLEWQFFTVDMDALDIVLLLAAAYVIVSQVFHRVALHHMGEGELVEVIFSLEGRSRKLLALRDSGNTLQDPLTGRPILVVEGHKLLSLFPRSWAVTREHIEKPIEAMEFLSEIESGRKFRILPYRAVGVDCGMLLALRVDSVRIDGVDYPKQLVALSPTAVSDGGGYSALVGLGFGQRERVKG